MSQYPTVIELSSLDGNNGFKLPAAHHLDLSGFDVASAGDVNGDGFDDIIVGAPYAGASYSDTGRSFVVFGKAGGFAPEFDLSTLDGNNGFTFSGGIARDDRSGFSVGSAGDVNGDGFADVIIGAFARDPNANYSGAAYVVFGKAGGFDAGLDLFDLDGNNGFAINGENEYDFAGWSVSTAGDVNGDGIDDVILGATGGKGAAYVVFGQTSPFTSAFELSSIDGNNGFRIKGVALGDSAGYSVSTAGDVNGDGVADVIVGASRATPNGPQSGASYVVFGTSGGFDAKIDLVDLDGSNGFTINGLAAMDYAGVASSAGDINGDGFADVVIGARGADPHGNDSGAAYVLFGTAAGFDAFVDLTGLDGTNGFMLAGVDENDHAGVSVAAAGDVNGDGFADIIVGAEFADSDTTLGVGAAYVVFGSAGGFPAQFNLSDIDGNNGFRVIGEEESYGGAGKSVASAGDVNGDGFDDIMIGDPHSENFTGASYVIFGSMPGEAVIRIGTNIANTIHGGNFDDTLRGLAGRDTLYGHDGNDTLRAGQGSDTLIGGAGNDTLTGRTGGDFLSGGAGDDTFFYDSAADSTGNVSAIDIVKGADFTSDVFDVPAGITGIDATIGSGVLRKGHFDTDMAAAADGAHLGANHAVLFAPDSGSESGKIFLLVDVNGVAGYQTGEDLVIQLSHSVHLASLGTEDFI